MVDKERSYLCHNSPGLGPALPTPLGGMQEDWIIEWHRKELIGPGTTKSEILWPWWSWSSLMLSVPLVSGSCCFLKRKESYGGRKFGLYFRLVLANWKLSLIHRLKTLRRKGQFANASLARLAWGQNIRKRHGSPVPTFFSLSPQIEKHAWSCSLEDTIIISWVAGSVSYWYGLNEAPKLYQLYIWRSRDLIRAILGRLNLENCTWRQMIYPF